MSEQDGTHVSTKPCRSGQVSTQETTLQRPANDDKEVWKKFWKSRNQPWRTEPEISKERQEYLAERRKIEPDIEQGISPFKEIDPKLSRADIEWLLSTHENNRGPVDWNDESQRERGGLDLRGADLRDVDLRGLPLARMIAGQDQMKKSERYEAVTFYFHEIDIFAVHLEGADLSQAHLEGANLSQAFFDSAMNLEKIVLSNNASEAASLCDIHWGDVNVAVVDWSTISR